MGLAWTYICDADTSSGIGEEYCQGLDVRVLLKVKVFNQRIINNI